MLALQALCAYDGVGEAFDEYLNSFLRDGEVLHDLGIEHFPTGEMLIFARALARGAWSRRQYLNEQLSRTAAHWSLDRMTPVDRNVLRLGLYELLEHPETAPQIVINEAIELARRFGDADSPSFVNGVLDALRRTLVNFEEPDAPSASPLSEPQRESAKGKKEDSAERGG